MPNNELLKKAESGNVQAMFDLYLLYDCPEVWTLRRFWDETLSCSWLGRRFIRIYYATSPLLVSWFGRAKLFNAIARFFIEKLVKRLQNKGVDSSRYYGV